MTIYNFLVRKVQKLWLASSVLVPELRTYPSGSTLTVPPDAVQVATTVAVPHRPGWS
jgi:hypothetical protein